MRTRRYKAYAQANMQMRWVKIDISTYAVLGEGNRIGARGEIPSLHVLIAWALIRLHPL